MKLIFEFSKTGNMIYISHLDLMRLFLRVLRMTGLRPAYSQGFNPHPKMSFALPLTLGILSVAELLEFEVESVKDIENSIISINERLPEGIKIKAWCKKPEQLNKPLASYVSAAVYEFMCDGIDETTQKLESFFANKSVTIQKFNKKKGIYVEKDVRSQMLEYRIVKDMRGRMLAEATLSAAPGETLGPLVFFKAFCEASGLDYETQSPIITRTAILQGDRKPITDSLNLIRL